jgi:hypothetical protein
MDAFNGVDFDYRRVLAEMNTSYGGVPGMSDAEIMSSGHTKQDVNVGLPPSCDPPGPNNPPKQLVWIVSLISSYSSHVFRTTMS